MPQRAFPVLIAGVVVLLAAMMSMFTVKETQLAIRTEFGAIVGINYKPGLHFKWPWDQVVRFERRVLTHSHTGETFLTNDNRGLIVDFYIKWRVQNASRFFQATGGQEGIAGERISEIVKDGIKSVVAQRSLEQIVASERQVIREDMFSRAVEPLGVELVDVRIQRIDLPDDVSNRVYESMKQNFAQIATRLRAEGQKRAVSIRSEAQRKRTEIISDAQRTSLQIRGEADAEAAAVYANAYSKYPEFYSFYRSLQAYERSIGKQGDILVVSPDGEFFKYLKNSGRR